MKNEIQETRTANELIVAVKFAAEVAQMPNDIHKSLKTAKAVSELRKLIKTDEIAGVLMELQGSALGFKTDHQGGGYEKAVVVDCALVALSLGLNIHGNEFNIIGGNCYPAQAGFDRILREYCQLHKVKRQVVPCIPTFLKMEGKQSVFEVTFDIFWQRPGEEKQKSTQKWHLLGRTHDQVIGKGKKRAYQWLYNELSNNSLPLSPLDEGDIIDGGDFIKTDEGIKPASEAAKPAQKPSNETPGSITAEQTQKIREGLDIIELAEKDFLSMGKGEPLASIEDMPAKAFAGVMNFINKKIG